MQVYQADAPTSPLTPHRGCDVQPRHGVTVREIKVRFLGVLSATMTAVAKRSGDRQAGVRVQHQHDRSGLSTTVVQQSGPRIPNPTTQVRVLPVVHPGVVHRKGFAARLRRKRSDYSGSAGLLAVVCRCFAPALPPLWRPGFNSRRRVNVVSSQVLANRDSSVGRAARFERAGRRFEPASRCHVLAARMDVRRPSKPEDAGSSPAQDASADAARPARASAS